VTIHLTTLRGKLITAIWKCMPFYDVGAPKVDTSDLETLSPSPRVQAIALSFYLLILERFFWHEIASPLALHCLVPIIIDSKMSPLIVRRTLHAMRTRNACVLGSLIVCHCLDGTIRRRSFCDVLTPEKVFRAIPTRDRAGQQPVLTGDSAHVLGAAPAEPGADAATLDQLDGSYAQGQSLVPAREVVAGE
jgi:hypothetical protein